MEIDNRHIDREEERQTERKKNENRQDLERKMKYEPMKTFEAKLSEKTAHETLAKDSALRDAHNQKKSKEEKNKDYFMREEKTIFYPRNKNNSDPTTQKNLNYVSNLANAEENLRVVHEQLSIRSALKSNICTTYQNHGSYKEDTYPEITNLAKTIESLKNSLADLKERDTGKLFEMSHIKSTFQFTEQEVNRLSVNNLIELHNNLEKEPRDQEKFDDLIKNEELLITELINKVNQQKETINKMSFLEISDDIKASDIYNETEELLRKSYFFNDEYISLIKFNENRKKLPNIKRQFYDLEEDVNRAKKYCYELNSALDHAVLKNKINEQVEKIKNQIKDAHNSLLLLNNDISLKNENKEYEEIKKHVNKSQTFSKSDKANFLDQNQIIYNNLQLKNSIENGASIFIADYESFLIGVHENMNALYSEILNNSPQCMPNDAALKDIVENNTNYEHYLLNVQERLNKSNILLEEKMLSFQNVNKKATVLLAKGEILRTSLKRLHSNIDLGENEITRNKLATISRFALSAAIPLLGALIGALTLGPCGAAAGFVVGCVCAKVISDRMKKYQRRNNAAIPFFKPVINSNFNLLSSNNIVEIEPHALHIQDDENSPLLNV